MEVIKWFTEMAELRYLGIFNEYTNVALGQCR
jgi:hypothetical protein